jgi:hypothetical protein
MEKTEMRKLDEKAAALEEAWGPNFVSKATEMAHREEAQEGSR